MDFSDNAYLKLSQRFPDIVPYVTGFFDLTEELNKEDDSLQVGSFQIVLGPDTYFIPVICKNSVIQPLDSVVKAETNLFFPALPAYLRTLVDTPLSGFGKNQKIPNTAVKNPNIYSLVVPPRTGKFVYASSSKALELLGLAPVMYKQALVNALKEDEDFASSLHSAINLEELAEVLKASAAKAESIASTAAKATENTDVSILVDGTGDLSEDEIQSIIQKGYAIRGEPAFVRVAVPVQDFVEFGRFEKLRVPCGTAECRQIVMHAGDTKLGVFLKDHPVSVTSRAPKLFSSEDVQIRPVIFSDGTYTTTEFVVTKGDPVPLIEGLQELLSFAESSSAIEALPGNCAILSTDGQLVFLGTLTGRQMRGGSLFFDAVDMRSPRALTFHVIGSLESARRLSDSSILLPANYRVVYLTPLEERLSASVNEAQQLTQMRYWDQFKQVNVLRANGVNEFLYNGDNISGAPLLLQRLVVEENIAPAVAEAFMKTAQETGKCEFFITKQADVFGNLNSSQFVYPQADTSNQFPDGEFPAEGFVQNVKMVSSLEDPDLVNSTIIAELLQAPSLKQYAENYLPDIRLSIDRLGRILFLSRMKLSDMFTGENGIELMTTVNVLKGVYTSLGSLYFSLQRLPDDRDDVGEAQKE